MIDNVRYLRSLGRADVVKPGLISCITSKHISHFYSCIALIVILTERRHKGYTQGHDYNILLGNNNTMMIRKRIYNRMVVFMNKDQSQLLLACYPYLI